MSNTTIDAGFTLSSLLEELNSLQNPTYAKNLSRFFKTGKGEYGEGDQFLGIKMPSLHSLADKYYKYLRVGEVVDLLDNPFHEIRMVAALILVRKYQKSTDTKTKVSIYDVYLKVLKKLNNWDFIDLTASKILGAHLRDFCSLDYSKNILESLAKSNNLWKRRAALIATFAFIDEGDPSLSLFLTSHYHLKDHDLLQKALGWILREIGKRIDENILTTFLDENVAKMNRTALRYSIEKLSPEKRLYYLNK